MMQKLIYSLILFIPVTLIAEYVLHNPTLAFVGSCLGIIPMAKLMGDATEAIVSTLIGAAVSRDQVETAVAEAMAK